jgi:serine/threonine protein kinase
MTIKERLQQRSLQMVGDYILQRTLGEGEFGKVKLAKHMDNDTEVNTAYLFQVCDEMKL